MKYKSVSTIAAILCGTLLAFAVFPAVFAQTGVKTAELELTPPAEAFDTAPMPVGIIHFSFATGKTEWLPKAREHSGAGRTCHAGAKSGKSPRGT